MYWGSNGLIGATGAPFDDYFKKNILGIFLKKPSKNLLNFFKLFLYYFVKVCLKKFPRKNHFQNFSSPFIA